MPSGVRSLGGMSADDLLAAQTKQTAIDAPWVNKIDSGMLADDLQQIRSLSPSVTLSGRLTGTPGIVEGQLRGVEQAPDAPPFVGYDYDALAAMLGN